VRIHNTCEPVCMLTPLSYPPFTKVVIVLPIVLDCRPITHAVSPLRLFIWPPFHLTFEPITTFSPWCPESSFADSKFLIQHLFEETRIASNRASDLYLLHRLIDPSILISLSLSLGSKNSLSLRFFLASERNWKRSTRIVFRSLIQLDFGQLAITPNRNMFYHKLRGTHFMGLSCVFSA